jgi:hypothetical protein
MIIQINKRGIWSPQAVEYPLFLNLATDIISYSDLRSSWNTDCTTLTWTYGSVVYFKYFWPEESSIISSEESGMNNQSSIRMNRLKISMHALLFCRIMSKFDVVYPPTIPVPTGIHLLVDCFRPTTGRSIHLLLSFLASSLTTQRSQDYLLLLV